MSSVVAPLRRVVASRELLWNLTLRELRTKYRRSFLGWTWSMLNPLATVAIYSFVFGYLFETPGTVGDPSGISVFALYLLCSLLPWNFFQLVTGLGMASLVGNAALVRKVAFPREQLVFANVLHGVVQFSIEMSLLAVAMLVAGSPFLPFLPIVILMMVFLAMFSAGIALALAALYVYFRDMSYLWQIASQVWFFATPIVYSEEVLKGRLSPVALTILEWNPMAIFGRGFRSALDDGRFPGWSNLGACFGVGLISLTLGWTLFTKLSRRFAEEM